MNSIAIDLGAESGRVFLGRLDGGALSIEEIHRFPNGPIRDGDSLRWDVRRMWNEIANALASPALPKIESIGVDAWGVDYALLDERGELLENPYHYRDPRNQHAMDEALKHVSKNDIYRETGVQFMPINTLYQLYAAKLASPEPLASARQMLMIPDLFHYWLSGSAVCEYTAASTSQFLNPKTRDWSGDLLHRLGLPSKLPARIVEPGTLLGVEKITGARVIAPASHDTASAVAAISAKGSTAFLSSGTWSLIGIELAAPVISDEAMRLNFTNEGGINGTTRLLKNVMGLWLLQGCRKRWSEQGRDLSHQELIAAAELAPSKKRYIDPDDPSLLNPSDMLAAIDQFCKKTHQPVPDSPGAYTRAILESLAAKYAVVLRDLEGLTGRKLDTIHVIGGGSKNALLNQLTANATGKRVVAGPAEASVLGNLGVQIVATGALESIADFRELVERSFPVRAYEPL